MFVHVTVEPAATSTASGAKAVLVNVEAFTGIETAEDDMPGVDVGPGVGEGDGVGDGVVDGDE